MSTIILDKNNLNHQIPQTLGHFPIESERKKHQVSADPAFPCPALDIQNASNGWQWVYLHEDEAMQKTMLALFEKIQLISFDSFLEKLAFSIDSIKSQMQIVHGNGFDFSKHTVVFIEGGKSNKWVAELAYAKCGIVPSMYFRLGEKDARNFEEFCSVEKNKSNLQRLFNGKSIVLLDDGAYSGKQMSDHVKKIKELCIQYSLGVRSIDIVAPFMTDYSVEVITQSHAAKKGKKSKEDIPLHIADHEKIETLNDLEESQRATIMNSWYRKTKVNPRAIGLVYYDHKIPNSQSFPEPMVRGSIYDSKGSSAKSCLKFFPDIISPYKQ